MTYTDWRTAKKRAYRTAKKKLQKQYHIVEDKATGEWSFKLKDKEKSLLRTTKITRKLLAKGVAVEGIGHNPLVAKMTRRNGDD